MIRSRFLNFGDDIRGQSITERITDATQRIPHRLLILAFPSRVWSPNLNYATSLRVRERIDRERATELAILEWWCPCAKFRKQLETCFSWKILWAPRAETNPQSKDSGALPSRLKEFHFYVRSGSKDPRSRRALKKLVRYLTNSPQLLKFVVRKSEFVSLT